MAHFAKINENNIVETVVVVSDELQDRGQDYLANELGMGGTWIKCSYNTAKGQHRKGGTPLRGNFPSIGYKYDSQFDAFIPPKLYPTWKLNYTTFQWIPPIDEPAYVEGYAWKWSHDNQEWIQVAIPN